MESSNFYGFVNGHVELEQDHLFELKGLISSDFIERENAVRMFELEFAKFLGEGRATTFASGRMGFFSLMEVLGIKRGDEVVLQSSNCAVMVNAVLRIGAKPVFVDIDLHTLGTCPNSVREAVTTRTKLIVAQHSFGIPCAIEEIKEIADEKDIFLLEDCALSFGSELNGKKLGKWGDASLFSFDHSKPLNCFLGGCIYTENEILNDQLHGYRDKLPDLSQVHQEKLFKEMLFERSFYNPRSFKKGKLIRIIRNLSRKLLSQKGPFLTAEYGLPVQGFYPYPAKMPAFAARLGTIMLKKWLSQAKFRKNLLHEFTDYHRNSKCFWLPSAYFDESRNIVPLRLVAYRKDDYKVPVEAYKYIDLKSTWFQQVIIACDDPTELGYTDGSCYRSEWMCKRIINLPCTFDEKFKSDFVTLIKNIFNG